MGATILYDDKTTTVADARAAGGRLWLTPAAMHEATGWKLEPEGLCRGDACVRTAESWVDADGNVDVTAFAEHMGQPLVREGDEVFAFGESVANRRNALASLEAPDFTLPDIDGRMHSLSDYRGKKVFMYSWGSY